MRHPIDCNIARAIRSASVGITIGECAIPANAGYIEELNPRTSIAHIGVAISEKTGIAIRYFATSIKRTHTCILGVIEGVWGESWLKQKSFSFLNTNVIILNQKMI